MGWGLVNGLSYEMTSQALHGTDDRNAIGWSMAAGAVGGAIDPGGAGIVPFAKGIGRGTILNVIQELAP